MELIERIDARLQNLWAEKYNCELKHHNPDCPECAQADEIMSEFQDCKAAIEEFLQLAVNATAITAPNASRAYLQQVVSQAESLIAKHTGASNE